MTQSEIRSVRAEELAQIARKDARCFTHEDDFWDEAMFAAQLPDERRIFLAACAEGEVLGYLCMSHVLDEAEVVRIGVFPEHRGRCLGEALLREGIARCAGLGVTEIILEVRESNAPAKALYSRLGFVPVGRRRGYYPREHEDAILMKLTQVEGVC